LTGAPSQSPPAWQAALALIATFLLYIGAALLVGGSDNKFAVLLLEMLLIVPAALVAWSERYSLRGIFRMRAVPFMTVPASVLLGLGLGVLGDAMDRVVQRFLPMPDDMLEGLKAFMVFHSPGEAAVLVVSVVAAAGLVEEMLFRGFLQGSLERSGGPVKAVLVSALVFSALHLNPWWAVQIFLLGVCLGFLAWRYGSIWPGVVIHAVNNAVSLAFMNTDESRLTWYMSADRVTPGAFCAGVLLTAAGFLIILKTDGRQDREPETPRREPT
jgi:uncharacterized protein